jgi:hypothetical protein
MYVDPTTVHSPKSVWTLDEVIFSTGQGGWSVARGTWYGKSVLGMRWNGSDDEDGNGSPQSRGFPTWFIIPEQVESVLVREIERLGTSMGVVECKVWRPEGYDLGAWKVDASLGPQAKSWLGGMDLLFQLPALPGRLCRADKDYYRAIGDELWGCFVDGEWHGHLYTNGVSEAQNQTTVDAFRDAFIQNVVKRFESKE